MILTGLTEQETELVRECMLAFGESQLLEDWEFPIRMGVGRSEFLEILAGWENLDEQRSVVARSINNTLNEICHGLPPEELMAHPVIGPACVELDLIFPKWRKARGRQV